MYLREAEQAAPADRSHGRPIQGLWEQPLEADGEIIRDPSLQWMDDPGSNQCNWELSTINHR